MEKLIYKPLLCPTGVILPEEPRPSSESPYVQLNTFVNNILPDFKVARLIIAISVAVKTISATLRKKAGTGMKILGLGSNPDGPTDVEVSNEVFFQMIKDTGVVWQVGCATHSKPDTFREFPDAEYVVNFTAQDGPPDLMGRMVCTSTFAIFKKIPQLGVEDHTLQPGRNILYSGYAIYGPATVLYLSLSENRVDGFILDGLIGELILFDKKKTIPFRSPLYIINEGLSFYYSQKLLNWLEKKKNPDNGIGAVGRFFMSKIADIHRVLKNGGIYCHPKSKFMNSIGPHRLVYECQPMAHIITQAGGLATDGKSWLLDIKPTHLHCKTSLFIGSTFEVQLLLKYLNPNMLMSEDEYSKDYKIKIF